MLPNGLSPWARTIDFDSGLILPLVVSADALVDDDAISKVSKASGGGKQLHHITRGGFLGTKLRFKICDYIGDT